MRRRALQLPLAAVLLAGPGAAQAHLVNSGLGPLYDGALHLLLSPTDLLGLVAAALLAGLRGRQAARLTVIVLPTAWLFAGLIGMRLSLSPDTAWLNMVSVVVLGSLVAADARLPPVIIGLFAGLYGVIHGLFDGSALVAMGAGAVSLFGIVLVVLLLVLLTSAAVIPVQAFWARIAVRIVGSWVVAVGLLMLGWMAQGMA